MSYYDYDDNPGLEDFAEPGGRSALRAASKRNPRNLPCPTCGTKNVLTPADRARGYQCNRCADRDEGMGF
jgi:DNA-directed RNA polymerase subunit RPC12/RpoP